MTAAPPHVREDFGLERLNALSDGVFAIILTLLVLELKLPDLAAGETVPDALAANSHVFVAWLISFLAIARFWVVHHRITANLQACRTGTIAINFAVLGAASLMPFTADALGNAKIAEPWSTVVFAANFALVSLALGLLARHAATEEGLLRAERASTALTGYRRHHLVVLPLVSLGAAVLAFTHPYLSIALLAVEFAAAAWAGVRRTPLRADTGRAAARLRGVVRAGRAGRARAAGSA